MVIKILSKDSCESPYIVRSLDGITVNGVSIDEYPVVPPQEIIVKNFSNLLFGNLSVSKNKTISKSKISS